MRHAESLVHVDGIAELDYGFAVFALLVIALAAFKVFLLADIGIS